MSKAWEQFARWRLAKTRWNCEPQDIPASEKAAFEQAWRRQRFLEQAIIQQARDLPLTDALLQRIDASLAELLTERVYRGRTSGSGASSCADGTAICAHQRTDALT
jgi:peptidyl-prolyl cis-trans isomerase C